MIVVFRRRAPGIFSWLIRQWTRSEFSHSEVLLNGNTMFSAVEGIGVRKVLVAEDFDPKKWTIVHVPTDTSEDIKTYHWCEEQLGDPYDWAGIFFCQVFKFGRQHQSRWFCSEFCTAALQSIGRFPGVKPYQQSPGKLYKLLTGERK